MGINLQPPAASEIEISLFGPGTGECIVAHLGNNEWMIVDSCSAYGTRQPIALSYLKELGISFDDVKCVVITHFHDDHIRGMASVIDSCVNAEIYISGALTTNESIAFLLAHAEEDILADRLKPSTFEIAKILKACGERHVRLVVENTALYRRNGVEVNALSPSSVAVAESRLSFEKGFVEAGVGFRKLANKLHPNLCAIALHVCNGTDTILLGSDLEVSSDPGLGWEAVLRNMNKPSTMAALFKVPHHGSKTGHSNGVISKMLKSMPVSILTTFDSSSLPREEDIERICKYSSRLYHTTLPKSSARLPKRGRAVEECLAAVTKSRRALEGRIGHIQVRMVDGQCVVQHNEHAGVAA